MIIVFVIVNFHELVIMDDIDLKWLFVNVRNVLWTKSWFSQIETDKAIANKLGKLNILPNKFGLNQYDDSIGVVLETSWINWEKKGQ